MTKKLNSLNQPETKLLAYLRKHPELFERLNAIVELSQGKEGTILNANEIESLLIEELRKLRHPDLSRKKKDGGENE